MAVDKRGLYTNLKLKMLTVRINVYCGVNMFHIHHPQTIIVDSFSERMLLY